MTTHIVKARRLALIMSLMLWGAMPGVQAAERELHWDALEVDARLDADGVLDVIEHHTMVFTGDWNGGERVFNLRPRQKLEFISLERVDTSAGAQQQLRETRRPDNVDEFSWPDRRTLRWRSRLPSDPPFASTSLTYVLHYRLSGILLKDEAQYRLDHDFAFPDRAGSIARYSLNAVLEAAGKKRLSPNRGMRIRGTLTDLAGRIRVAVGTSLTRRPPHGSVRAGLPHTALILDRAH